MQVRILLHSILWGFMEVKTGKVQFIEINLKADDLVELTSGRTLQPEFSIPDDDYGAKELDFNIQVSLLGSKADI